MLHLRGDLTRHAASLVRLIFFPTRLDRFFSLVRLGAQQLSLVLEQHELDLCFPGIADDPLASLSPIDWRCVLMASLGTGLEESGVMVRFTAPLADAGISIFKVTTLANDYSLLRRSDVAAAFAKLQATLANVEILAADDDDDDDQSD